MIHRLTGGRWGELAAPAIAPAAAATPLLIVLAIPLFIAIPTLYPWSHHPDAIKPDVLSYYLNTPAFIVRTVLALVGWTALAILLPRNAGPRGRLLAALGLVFHAIGHQQRIDRLVFVARSAVHVIVVRRQRRDLLTGRRACLDGSLGAGAGRRSRHRRSWRFAARDRARHHLHRFHGRAGDLVRRPAARGSLVRRARLLALDGIGGRRFHSGFAAADFGAAAVARAQCAQAPARGRTLRTRRARLL